MQKITTFITYDHGAEDAVRFYLEVFENGKILDSFNGPDGKVLTLSFELFGQTYHALNAKGPDFELTHGISLFVSCETQAEIDRYWERLTADGGKEVACGWLVDRFGVSWQIVPGELMKMLWGEDKVKSGRAFEAMMKMKKLDLAALRRAYEGN